jgi:holin-like protein
VRALRILAGVAVLYAFLRLGELLGDALGLPLPGSVLGMLLLWAALEARVVRLAWLRDGATTLLGLLGLLFVPAGAGFVAFVDAGWVWIGALAVTVVGGVVTVGLTGLVVQRGMERG